MKNKAIAIAAVVTAISLGAAGIPALAHGTEDGQPQMSNQTSGMKGGQQGGQMSGQKGGMMMMMKKMMKKMMSDDKMGEGHDDYMEKANTKPLNLSVDDVRKIVEGRLIMHGNDRLKLGKIEVVDDKNITAEIVTVDNSLVYKLEFDRKTGARHMLK